MRACRRPFLPCRHMRKIAGPATAAGTKRIPAMPDRVRGRPRGVGAPGAGHALAAERNISSRWGGGSNLCGGLHLLTSTHRCRAFVGMHRTRVTAGKPRRTLPVRRGRRPAVRRSAFGLSALGNGNTVLLRCHHPTIRTALVDLLRRKSGQADRAGCRLFCRTGEATKRIRLRPSSPCHAGAYPSRTACNTPCL